MNTELLDAQHSSPGALALRAEIDTQISTAKEYPRHMENVLANMQTWALTSPDDMFYSLPRDGNAITGGSIRFAEMSMAAWGNCRAGAEILTIDKHAKTVTVVGRFHDLESNAAVQTHLTVNICSKNGRLYSADMINTTANAACAKAKRNAILQGIPQFFWSPILEKCEADAKGAVSKTKSLPERRKEMLAAFAKLGIHESNLLHIAKRDSVDKITQQDIEALASTYKGLQSGDLTIDDLLPPEATDIEEDAADKIGDQTPAPATADTVADDLAESIKLKLINCIEQAETEESLAAALDHAAATTSKLPDEDVGQAIYEACGEAHQGRRNELRKGG